MKAFKKMLVACLATATLFTGTITPALAYEGNHSAAIEVATQTQRRSFLQLQETISYTCGIYLRVNYTFNDAYGTISGINSIKMTKCPAGISNVSWTYTRMNGGEYYLIIVHYTKGGNRISETAKLWA